MKHVTLLLAVAVAIAGCSKPASEAMPSESNRQASADAIGTEHVQAAPENCPACAIGLTAESVFRRLDVDMDKFVTPTEFMRSPGMQDLAKATEVVGRLDKNGNGFIEADELGDLHPRRMSDPKSMRERLQSGDVPKPPPDQRPKGLGEAEPKEK